MLMSEKIAKFYKWKVKTTSTTQQLIHKNVNIYLKFWTKFPLSNRQPSKLPDSHCDPQ